MKDTLIDILGIAIFVVGSVLIVVGTFAMLNRFSSSAQQKEITATGNMTSAITIATSAAICYPPFKNPCTIIYSGNLVELEMNP